MPSISPSLGTFGSAVDLAEIRPESYLREGFFAADGSLRPGMSGIYSLATARHLAVETLAEKDLAAFVDRIRASLARSNGAGEELAQPLSSADRTELEATRRDTVASSATLRSACSIALGASARWRDVAAFAVHLQRIHQQLVYLTALSRPSS